MPASFGEKRHSGTLITSFNYSYPSRMSNEDLHEFYENYHTNHLKHAINEFPFRKAYWDSRIKNFPAGFKVICVS
jgi:hypothetical protein